MTIFSIRVVGCRALLCATAIFLAAGSTRAQFQQYRPPGDFQPQRETMDALLERSMKDARWRLGPFLAHAWIGLRDFGYVDEGGTRGSDITATLGLGLRFYLPVGQQTTFTAHVLPEYSFWLDDSERNALAGRYGAGIFSNLGRIGLEASARQEENIDFFSNEINRRLNTLSRYGVLSLEVDLGRGVAVFGAAEPRRYEFPQQAEEVTEALESLVRDEQVYRASVRFELPHGFVLSLGAESSEADFDDVVFNRASSGVAPILQASYDGTSLFFRLNAALRDLDPEPGSVFIPYREPSGDFQLSWRFRPRWELQLFGESNLRYTVEQEWIYYQDDEIGVAGRISLSANTSFRLSYRVGVNDYVGDSSSRRREDDLETWGLDTSFHLGRGLVLGVGAYQTDYTPEFTGNDRRTISIRTGLSLGASTGSPWG